MKTRSKALLLTLCAVLLVAASVLGTMAYLTDEDKVENTFTVGKVDITLDEASVDVNGATVEGAGRVRTNEYKLMPGHEYTKDPTVHVTAGSENSWIFVKVEDGISAYEDTSLTIHDQLATNKWTALNGVANVYYKEYSKSDSATDLVVFSKFKIADKADEVAGWGNFKDVKVTVTAYAVQKDGFDTAIAAWKATFGATTTTSNP